MPGDGQRRGRPAPALRELAEMPPVAPQRDGVPQRQRRLTAVDGPRHAAPEVAAVGVQTPEPVLVPRAEQVGLRRLGQRQVVQRVPPLDLVGLAGVREARCRILPDDVEHVVARVRAMGLQHDQALVDQGADAVQRVACVVDAPGNVADGVQAPATREHGETAEERLLARPEQIVAPPGGVADSAPPGPVSVSSRTCGSRSLAVMLSSSRARPRSRVGGAGRSP
ncbi:MAG TPA: hypothetical protein VGJ95_01990, partial [Pseudonocardiaceae bacterium]